MTELHGVQTANVEEALTEDAPAIVGNLIDKYVDRERVTFIGSYLRMFTDSPVLICGWLSIENMKKLFQTIKSEDFNVQSDAIETTQQLFGTETRANNSKMTEFVEQNMDAVLHLFYDLYKEIDPDDLDEEAEEQSNEEGPNFFELKELMKIEYQLLQDYR